MSMANSDSQKLIHLRYGEQPGKCVLASSLSEAERKGIDKFGLEAKKIKYVFKYEDSVIDEEIFKILPGNCILHMEGSDTQTDSTTSLEKSTEEPGLDSPTSPREIDESLDNIEEFADRMVASLSDETRRCLKQPAILLARYTKFIAEMAYAISSSGMPMNSKTAYMAVGRTLYQKYPAIGVVGTAGVSAEKGKKKGFLYPWSFFTTRLSQKMRHIRMIEKTGKSKQTTKSTPSNVNILETVHEPTAVKSVRPLEGTQTTARKRLDLDSDQEDDVPDLADSPKSPEPPEPDDGAVAVYVEIEKPKPDKARIKEIMRVTFAQRRIKIQALGLQAMSKYKFLLRPDLLYHEWSLSPSFVPLEVYRPRILSALLTVKRLKNNLPRDAPTAVKDADFRPLLKYVEEVTKYAGQITRPVVRTLKQGETASTNKESTAPVLYESEEQSQAFIAVGKYWIKCRGSSLIDYLYNLISVYYVVDRNYPRSYSGVLGFVQEAGLGDAAPYNRSPASTKFMTKFLESHDK